MERLLKKLKNQKGATGTDILLSAAIIVVSVGIVSMLYVNTLIQARNITRTSGATRIATNIIENIDAMSYEDFLKELNGSTQLSKSTDVEKEFFSTKIPIGYELKLKAEPVYGSHTLPSEQFDLVRKVDMEISYKVGKAEEKVNFNTVKKRELIGECNAPATSYLRSFLTTNQKFYPVKFSKNANAYIKTTEDDPEWYSYSNKEWAIAFVSSVSESSLFDVNGKFVGNLSGVQKYVWIPRYFYSGNTAYFAFNASNNQYIKQENLPSKDLSSSLKYNTCSSVEGWTLGSFENNVTGKWIAVSSINSEILNNSQYGPCIEH